MTPEELEEAARNLVRRSHRQQHHHLQQQQQQQQPSSPQYYPHATPYQGEELQDYSQYEGGGEGGVRTHSPQPQSPGREAGDGDHGVQATTKL